MPTNDPEQPHKFFCNAIIYRHAPPSPPQQKFLFQVSDPDHPPNLPFISCIYHVRPILNLPWKSVRTFFRYVAKMYAPQHHPPPPPYTRISKWNTNDLEHLQFFSCSLCHFLRILKIAYGLSGPKPWIFNRVFSHGIGFSLHIAWLIIVIWLTPLCYVRLQGAVSIRKTVLPGMAIPMLKIRRPNGRLIFNMEIAIRR